MDKEDKKDKDYKELLKQICDNVRGKGIKYPIKLKVKKQKL